ncbi:predicted protein [Chaetoceros tenuissimus]|uniref:Uncharacterized protein n=1 Tax=Chaetoceros tenuissimus TaxID=426638 RepID=A0AAD3H280_9STRA|nr:predicted protein [Chaetoceros tenuissimus]
MTDKRKLSRHLMNLAGDDKFSPILYFLLSSRSNEVNINVRNDDGDYLIHLLAFSICEIDGDISRDEKLAGLKCLIKVLERDFTAVNKIGEDGSSVLHCALASASVEVTEGDEEFDKMSSDCDSDSEEEDDDSVASFSSDDEDRAPIDRKYLKELETEAKENMSMIHEYCKELNDLTSYEMCFCVIYLLLKNGADPNVPLNNVFGIESEMNDEDEIELAFNREAIIQRWTPLMFVAQWNILAAIQVATKLKCSEEGTTNDYDIERAIAVPYVALKLLLEYGADRTYMMANGVKNWNLVQVFASASHIFHRIPIEKDKLEDSVESIRTKCAKVLSIEEKEAVKNSTQTFTTLDRVLMDISVKDDKGLSKCEVFAESLLKNNQEKMLELCSENDNSVIQEWLLTNVDELMIIIQAVWGNSDLDGTTLFELATSCFSLESLQVILNDGNSLPDENIYDAIVAAFEYFGDRALSENDEESFESRREQQDLMVEFLLDIYESDKQTLLDRLLIESCTVRNWTLFSPHATKIFLSLGADANVSTIQDSIQDNLKPLHLIAANCRGQSGVDKINWILEKNPSIDIFPKTLSEQQTPLDIALAKENFDVAKSFLNKIDNDQWNELNLTLSQAITVGNVAVHDASVELLIQALDYILSFSSEYLSQTKMAIGKLALMIFDQRSGFGKIKPLNLRIEKIQEALSLISQKQSEYDLSNLTSFVRDEISGYNILHYLLLSESSQVELRKGLLRSACEFMMESTTRGSLISQKSASKFGLYTPLHMAVSLGCEESIRVLLDFGADVTALDSENRRAIDLIDGERLQKLSDDVRSRLNG